MSKGNAGDCYTGEVCAPRALRIIPMAMIALLGGAACVASLDAGKPFRSDARRKLVVNRTTKPEVQKLLGPALATASDAEGREHWTYEHTLIIARRPNPFGGSVAVRQMPYERLDLT